jgi:hypothetical protein
MKKRPSIENRLTKLESNLQVLISERKSKSGGLGQAITFLLLLEKMARWIKSFFD